MLTELKLKNFKCFKEETIFTFGKINLLTGINGRGKSTLLQSMLLVKQSLESGLENAILFNGSCVQLGKFGDLKNTQVSPKENIEMTFSNLDSSIHLKLSENPDDDTVLKISSDSLIISKKQGMDCREEFYNVDGESLDQFAYFIGLSRIHFISADRIGPQRFYEKKPLSTFVSSDKQGINTVNIAAKKQGDLINDLLCVPNSKTKTLRKQIGEWLSVVTDTADIDIEFDEIGDYVIDLKFRFGAKGTFKPNNVGFGYSYILPIIVAGLIAKPNEILIIENPEAHLHPKAQSELTKFLAKVAAGGVQIFIESHSEHILNSLRIATIDTEENTKILEKEEVNILYFDNSETYFKQIKIMEDNDLSLWEKDFFDQTNNDYKTIYGY